MAIDPKELRDIDLVRSTIDKGVSTLALWQRDLLTSDVFLKRCESPLEAAWRVWWHVVLSGLGRSFSGAEPHATYQHEVQIDGQTFRLDVVINHWRPDGSLVPVLAVELDGHTYHERTPQQVADRNARDRALQLAGWTVLHFSYAEIVDRGLVCAIETLERFNTLTERQERSA
jgi:very-short-patch-repair endonuclease